MCVILCKQDGCGNDKQTVDVSGKCTFSVFSILADGFCLQHHALWFMCMGAAVFRHPLPSDYQGTGTLTCFSFFFIQLQFHGFWTASPCCNQEVDARLWCVKLTSCVYYIISALLSPQSNTAPSHSICNPLRYVHLWCVCWKWNFCCLHAGHLHAWKMGTKMGNGKDAGGVHFFSGVSFTNALCAIISVLRKALTLSRQTCRWIHRFVPIFFIRIHFFYHCHNAALPEAWNQESDRGHQQFDSRSTTSFCEGQWVPFCFAEKGSMGGLFLFTVVLRKQI